MSTASGLLVSLAGAVTHDFRRGAAPDAGARRRQFRAGALAAMVVPALLALVARDLDISVLVGWAFALAASTFCPLLLLGIWWDGPDRARRRRGPTGRRGRGDCCDLRRPRTRACRPHARRAR